MIVGFLFTLFVIAPIFTYFCDKDYMIHDKSCYYCDYANPKYHLEDDEVKCKFKSLNDLGYDVHNCEYRHKSINFWEWLL